MMKSKTRRFLLAFWLMAICALSQSQTFKFAAVQFPIEGNKTLPQFLAKVESYIIEAKRQEAEAVIFPELCTFDTWPLATKLSEQQISRQIAKDITPQYFAKVAQWSKAHQIAIFAGSSPNLKQQKIYNTALIALADGRQIYQDKVFLTHWEKDMGWAASSTISVFSAPWGKTVVLICYDAEFPVISQLLAKFSVETFVIPSMTEDQHGLRRVRWSAQARAIEHHAYVIVTGTVGQTSQSWDNFGQAVFLTPSEKGFPGVLCSGNLNKAEIVYAKFDFAQLSKSRGAKSHLYPVKDQNSKEQRIQVKR